MAMYDKKSQMLYSGKTLRDFVEALPREWISEDLMEALVEKGVNLSPTVCVDNIYHYFGFLRMQISLLYMFDKVICVYILFQHFHVVKYIADIKLVTGSNTDEALRSQLMGGKVRHTRV